MFDEFCAKKNPAFFMEQDSKIRFIQLEIKSKSHTDYISTKFFILKIVVVTI